MNKTEVLDQEKRKLLDNLWNQTPVIIKFYEEARTILEQQYRAYIIGYLRDGIDDSFSGAKNLDTRHVFTAKELHEALEKHFDKKIKISNIHHHLNILIENGFVEEKTSFLEGNKHTRYFGRTAKLFLFLSNPDNDQSKSNIEIISKMISEKYKAEEVRTNSWVKDILKSEDKKADMILKWISDNYDLIAKYNVNISILFSLLSRVFDASDNDFQELIKSNNFSSHIFS